MNNHKKIFTLAILLITIISFANADLLVNSTIDKKFLYPNEIGFVTIKILNDSNIPINLLLRIEGADNLVFIEEKEEKMTLLRELDNLNPQEPKQITIKVKALSVKKEPSAIFVYYGTEMDDSYKGLPFFSGTITQTKENPVEVISKAEKKQTESGESIITKLTITNNSGKEIFAIAGEIIAPKDFDIKTDPYFFESLKDKNSITLESEIMVPINANGEQKIIQVYGFFDEYGPHYFEKTHSFNFVKTNRTLLAIIGIVVLAAAIYLYIQQTKKGTDIKGSGEKK